MPTVLPHIGPRRPGQRPYTGLTGVPREDKGKFDQACVEAMILLQHPHAPAKLDLGLLGVA